MFKKMQKKLKKAKSDNWKSQKDAFKLESFAF
jgi:hypothetical protein